MLESSGLSALLCFAILAGVGISLLQVTHRRRRHRHSAAVASAPATRRNPFPRPAPYPTAFVGASSPASTLCRRGVLPLTGVLVVVMLALFAGGAQARTSSSGPVITEVSTTTELNLTTGYPYENYMRLGATIDPQGENTNWSIDYGLTDSYGSTTSDHAVSATDGVSPRTLLLGNLTATTAYHFRIRATNASDTALSADYTFTTADPPPPPPPPIDPGDPPVVDALWTAYTSNPATGLEYDDRTPVGAAIDPRGEDTSWSVEYGPTDAYGLSVAGGSALGTYGATTGSLTLTNLLPSTTYHFRFVATNASGSTSSVDATFMTAGPAVNIEPPTISAASYVGRQLSVWTDGFWAQTEYWNPVQSRQWQRCDASGEDCADIVGATANDYLIEAADLGSTLRVAVTVTNSYGVAEDGASTAYSAVTSVVTPVQEPVSTGAPTISGTAAEGGSLWVDPGTWSDDGAELSFQWALCSSTGEDCELIEGAASQDYTAAAADVGGTLRATVTAENEAGSDVQTSAPSDVIAEVQAPVNGVLPAVLGNPEPESELSVDFGEWTPSAYRFELQWQRCDADGESCSDIIGATSDSYLANGDDAGSTLRVVVTAFNLGLSGTAVSDPTAVIQQSDPGSALTPVNAEVPTILGDTIDGATLSATRGQWRYAPTSFSYGWYRCNYAGTECDYLGVSTQKYILTSDDVGATLRVEVVASNEGGSQSAVSTVTAVVTEETAAPTSVEPPAITGATIVGATLRVSAGTWTHHPSSRDYQWQLCDIGGAECTNVVDANAKTYDLTSADAGMTLRVKATAANAIGSFVITTDATDVIASAPTTCDVTGDAPGAGGGPANDDFSSAAVLTGAAGTVNGTLADATVQNDGSPAETGENSIASVGSASNPTRSVWYCWTPPASGAYTITTLGSPAPFTDNGWGINKSAAPPVVQIWSGRDWGIDKTSDLNALELRTTGQWATNGTPGQDDFEAYTQASFTAEGGTQYLVQVENDTDATPDAGDFVLNWSPQLDPDGDGILTPDDNCEIPDNPSVSYNPSQLDDYPAGGDGVGDACQSGVLVIHNNSSYSLSEFSPGEGSFRNLGDATGRSCASNTTCTLVDAPAGVHSYWHADGTDATGSSDAGDCPDPDTGALVDCNPPGADWTADFHYTFAGHGDAATGPGCDGMEESSLNNCYDEYTAVPWREEDKGPDTTPPNAGLEDTTTSEGVEVLTATDVPPTSQAPATGDPVIPEPEPAAPAPQSPIGPAPADSYTTVTWPADSLGLDTGLQVVTSTASGTTALTGVVEDDGTGTVIPGASVTISYLSCPTCDPVDSASVSDADGAFAFIDLPASDNSDATYSLVATANAYGTYTLVNQRFEPDETYEMKVTLTDTDQTIDARPLTEDEINPGDEDSGNQMRASARQTALTSRKATAQATRPISYSETNVPPVIVVGMFNVYDKTTHPAPPGKYFCDKREDQPSTIPAKRFSTIEYVLRVANAEVLQSTVPLNDRGKTAFLALALNYGWYHKTEFGSFDISDATDRQCMGEYPAHSAKLIALLQDVLDERVVDGSGDLLQTSYRSGHPPAVCNPRDYPAGTASQWDISVLDKDEPDQNGQNCFLNDWRDIVTHFYPSGTSVVPGQKPGKTFTSVKTLPRGKVRLGFFSTDSQNTSHTSDKATGWWYHVEVKDNGGSWHPYTTTHYVDSDRDVRKYVDVDPPAKCTRFFRVWASNPVDKDHGGPKSMFNRGKCVRKVDDD